MRQPKAPSRTWVSSGVSLREIASRAGVEPGTVHGMFGSKRTPAAHRRGPPARAQHRRRPPRPSPRRRPGWMRVSPGPARRARFRQPAPVTGFIDAG
ncbi:MAG: TetR family transcriptional regulator [Caulobacteraceae bacterium]